ncbi:RiPP maturation radical SAM C-methyltransferase [Actinoplanes sp. HUAS TT8]|uniref:RiPP maturation radical SAM C-methyltransferase n=1 Tax=Actinoplanes sp. HUAS TT8 TaxID=3447453 RepID=UPI003F52905E
MRVALVNMPWPTLSWPNLAISLLDTVLTGLGHQVTQLYENLTFAEHVLRATGGEVTPDDYLMIAENGHEHGAGEWVFTSSLYRPGWRLDEYTARLREDGFPLVDQVIRLHGLAPAYIAAAADRVLAGDPDLVGLTTTFAQTVPILALAAELKRRRPGLPIVAGGANCDDVMGVALHRNFPILDYVVQGEGERPLTELMAALAGERELSTVTGLCWRDERGTTVVNPLGPGMTAGDRLPVAHVRPYFDIVSEGLIRSWMDVPYMRLETSRGCWWGEKRQCTFCGLNAATIGYRTKPPERAWAEIERAVTEFGVLDIALTDNILDPAYFDTLLPRLAATDWDLRIFYEVKSNLRPDQMRILAAAGVTEVQPGIESLASGPLALMDKGATGAAQVRALRLFREHGIFPSWNYLFGFPGEDWARDYRPVVEQIAALVHLPPPRTVQRITLERFAPLFERPELGIDDPRAAAEWYAMIFDLPAAELTDLAYFFRYEPKGITDEQAAELSAAVENWQRAYEHSTLTYRTAGQDLQICDRRVGRFGGDFVLSGWEAVVYLSLERHLTVSGLAAALRAGDHPAETDRLLALLTRWQQLGLVYRDGDGWVALALPADPRITNGWRDRGDLVAG